MQIPSVRRRIGTVAAVAAMLLSVPALAACGSSGPQDEGGGGGTLDAWVYGDAATTVQRQLVKRFNKTSDVKVKLVEVPGENYQDKMRTAMGTPNAPDIFFNWGGGSIADFVEKDMLVDLTPVIEKDPELKEAFIPTILDAGAVNDAHYGIPMRGMQPVILFYNKEVFADAGAKPPTSWEDIMSLVDTFKEEGVTPFALAGADPWTELMWIEYLVDRYGGEGVFEKIRDEGAAGWDDPAVLKAAEMVKTLVDRGAFGKNYKSVNYTADGASTLFAKGKAAMHLMGSWEYSNQQANQPDFAKEGIGWTTFPAVPGGTGDVKNVVGNPTNYFSINSKVEEGEQRDAAIEFVKFAGKEAYAKDLVAAGDVPATTNAEALMPTHKVPEYATFQYEMVRDAPAFTLSWDQALDAKLTPSLHDNNQKLFNGDLSPKEFVAAMKDMM